jgi:hypothetical protein
MGMVEPKNGKWSSRNLRLSMAFAAIAVVAVLVVVVTAMQNGNEAESSTGSSVFASGSLGPEGAGGTVQLFVLPPAAQSDDPFEVEPLLTVDADEQGSFAIQLPEDLLQFDRDGVHDFFVLGMSSDLQFGGTAYFSMSYNRDHGWSPAEGSNPLHLVVNLHENDPDEAREDDRQTTGRD